MIHAVSFVYIDLHACYEKKFSASDNSVKYMGSRLGNHHLYHWVNFLPLETKCKHYTDTVINLSKGPIRFKDLFIRRIFFDVPCLCIQDKPL